VVGGGITADGSGAVCPGLSGTLAPMDEPIPCTHLDQIQDVTPSAEGCEDCLRIGGWWVHLRLCLSCGHVGCCDQSPNKHATAHVHASGHPIVQSFEQDEDWIWCYIDEVYLEPG